MNWIIQFVILFAFGLLARSSARIHLKLHPSERYESCVARNLSELSMFNEEDKERVNKIVMETSHRMQSLIADPKNPVSGKTVLRLFAAALACVVADCDSSERHQREQASLTALEACAESLKATAGTEVVKEMKQIFSAVNREIAALDAVSDAKASVESKKKEELGNKNKVDKEENHLEDETRKEKKECLEVDAEKKEEYPEKESEVKERSKRAYAPPFRFPAFRLPPQPNPTLESIIADKLSKSATFNNFFKFGLSQEDAVFYSRSMVASGLSGYRYDIIQEALNRVSSAMTRLGSYTGPGDYAFAIARSIASVLDAHDLAMFADAIGIGSSLVHQLDSMLGSNPSSTFSLSPSFGTVAVSGSGWGSTSAVVSSQVSGMVPLQENHGYIEPSFAISSDTQNDKAEFQNQLSGFLSQSQKISETFCRGPVPGVYEIMNSAFADYGYPISSMIATIVTNSINMLPTEAACTQYAEVISEIVADILDKNGLLQVRDPQTIANKISELISPNVQRASTLNPLFIGQSAFSGSDYQLNPSFTDYSDIKIPAFSVDQNSSSTVSSSGPNISLQQHDPILTNSTEFSFDDSPSAIKTSSKKKLPTELNPDGLSLPGKSPLSSDGSVATNSSWVIVDYPSDVITVLDQANLTKDSIDISPSVVLEPGPVIPESTSDVPESKEVDIFKTTKPEMKEITKAAEVTTTAPLSTHFQLSTVMTKSEDITPNPQVVLKDAFESPSKLSEFLMKEMEPALKSLNITSGDEKKQPDLATISGISTDSKITKIVKPPRTLEDSKLDEKDTSAQGKPSSEVRPSMEPPQQQNGPSDEVPLNAPEPIMDELTALVFADKVSSIVSSSISLIRSENLQFDELCKKLNELAPLVDLPPLDVFSEIPLIDYLLHVLNAVTYSLAGEK